MNVVTKWHSVDSVTSPGCGSRGSQTYMKLFVAIKMTRNNALNKVRVAATELPELLSHNTQKLSSSWDERPWSQYTWA